MIKILSIDGGGIRGIIPAMILAEIERRAGQPAARLFDLMAGTSTGGILALGLTKPDRRGQPQYTAANMARLYEDNGAKIFSSSCWRRILALGGLADYKYPSEGMKKVFAEYFGPARLKDALSDVLITAYEIEIRLPFFFRSRRARELPDYDFLIRDVALAAAAAPTYFRPCKLYMEGRPDYYALIDGGVYANNPALCAYVEARGTHPREEILLVSLGAGGLKRPLPYDEAVKWGLAGWARPMLEVVFDGVSDTVDYQLRTLLPPTENGVPRYYRLQPELKKDYPLDDAGPESVKMLKAQARALIQTNEETLDALCRRLLS